MTLTSFVFANSSWFEADLFSVQFANGAVIRATSHNADITGPDGFLYSSNLFGKWERGGITFERNALTSCDVTVTADSTVMFPGTTTPMLWVSKLFARASITITTCTIDITAPTVIVGSVVVFVGRCTTPSMTSTHATLHCADETYLLSEPWPRRVICAGCPWTLFDAQCGLSRTGFAISCAVGAGSTQTNLVVVTPLGSVGTDTLPYSKGYIVPTSGQAVGWPIMVTLQSDATHLNVQPFPLPLAVGDAFTLYPGCDGQKATCDTKFSNLANFGGMPNVPGPPAAVQAVGS